MLALYFSGEEDALSFTVWGGDRLQLEEIQQHLDLQGNKKWKRDTFVQQKLGFGSSSLHLAEHLLIKINLKLNSVKMPEEDLCDSPGP